MTAREKRGDAVGVSDGTRDPREGGRAGQKARRETARAGSRQAGGGRSPFPAVERLYTDPQRAAGRVRSRVPGTRRSRAAALGVAWRHSLIDQIRPTPAFLAPAARTAHAKSPLDTVGCEAARRAACMGQEASGLRLCAVEGKRTRFEKRDSEARDRTGS